MERMSAQYGAHVGFSQEMPDEHDAPVPPILLLDSGTWEDMNKPDVLTMTIVPGDELNNGT